MGIVHKKTPLSPKNFLAKCTLNRNKLCRFPKKNLGTTCHRTSVTFPGTIYTSEAQNYTKTALKSGPFRPRLKSKKKEKKKVILPVI